MKSFAFDLFLVWLLSNGGGLLATWYVTHSERAAAQRIQGAQRTPTWQEWKARFPLIGFNLVTLLAITEASVLASGGVFSWGGYSPAVQVAVFFLLLVVDDAYFYAYHRAIHASEFAFRRMHRIHHTVSAPVPMDYIYVHPLEWMLGAVGVVLGILLTFVLLGDVPAAAVLAYAIFRNVRELCLHSGLRTAGSPGLGLAGLAEHHDLHHINLRGNYATILHIWDRVFGTELKAEENPRSGLVPAGVRSPARQRWENQSA